MHELPRMPQMTARNKAIQWARRMLKETFVVLDTETTGLHEGEIVSIAITNEHGNAILDCLVKPTYAIPPDATAVHGITNAMVVDAAPWKLLTLEIERILTGRNVVVYNAVYDRKMMHHSAEYAGLPKTDWKTLSSWHCAMEQYAAFYGSWNSYHSNFKWHSLTKACQNEGIVISDGSAHTAIGDCIMTHALLRHMAKARMGDE